ncbi:MAG TPA: hypothetical protein PKM57_03440 [Kiritimatiellia bacterium]|nr:hypothetical protein [Kiritimatiellia bacterium]
MRTRVFFCFLLACNGIAQEIGYVETFSLADDREAALRELVPGTDDDYYFHALQAQNTGARQRFLEVMNRWQRDRDGQLTGSARELLNRQALLDYGAEPQATLDYLKRELGLTFAHSRKTGERLSNAPSAFDNAAIGPEALLRRALRDPRTLGALSEEGLAFVAKAKLTDEQRRNLLSRLSRPDGPNLVDLVAADLNSRDSGGFGQHAIHGMMTLSQLDALLKKLPGLRSQTAFVNAYLAKLVPENEVDLETDAAAREAYYERVWSFVKTLDPVHNSLKANVLYNRLRHDQRKGVYDPERFMEYVKLPRDVYYLRPEIRERLQRGDYLARLDENFRLISLPPVVNEEPLVRSYLLRFFREAAGYTEYQPYIRDDFLKPLFAEAKIVNGIGDPQQWVPLLTPDAYRRLKERVDIDFAEDNPDVIGAGDDVKFEAFVKNVPALLVKVYEINTFNYYRETGQPLNLAVNLDGLVASVSRRADYGEPPERRVARTFEFPEIKARGVYVVELIGNGKSSRALVQKGRLNVVQEVTAAGHAFTVLDENGKRVTDASGWLGGREFAAEKDGRILVPFSTAPKSERIVIRQGGFATLVRFDHRAENYALSAGVYVDREALVRREKALIALRPVLRVNGRPASLKLLEEVRLAVRSTDLQGIVTSKEFSDVALREDAETVQEILVPECAVALTVTLKAKIQNLSLNQKQELGDGASFALNGIERTAKTQALHVGQSSAGFYADLRGKNGEPLAGEPVHAEFLHRYFLDNGAEYVRTELKTDGRGRVQLGALDGIAFVRLSAAVGAECEWRPQRDACAYPAAVHGKAGATLRLPVMRTAADADGAASLLEMRRGQFVRDWREALAVKDGFLELRGLPAGDYSLWLKDARREVAVSVTQGEERDGYVVSPRRALELPRLAPLNVSAVAAGQDNVEIRLANATPFARVHLFATRYLPAYDVFGRLGFSGAAGLARQPWQPVRTYYESGRDIGDEYRYIIERQQAAKYPGNMLERPGLLLNPWALRTTESEAEKLAEGREYAGRAAGMAKADGGAANEPFAAAAATSEGYASLDFLKQPAVTLLNLVPDKEGNVVVPRGALKGLPFLRVLAVDPTATVLRCVALEDTPVETRELRLSDGFDPKKAYAEQKLVTPVQAKAGVTVGDVTTARFEIYDTVAKVYRLLATLNPDATFGEFSFVADWAALEPGEQRRLYSKYACHELSFFLYRKAPKFFEQVIRPYLRNKKDKTFMDHWLLGEDLNGYLEPWRFARLNAAERVLLGKRLRGQEMSLARDTRERADLLPPDMEAFNRRFDTAVQTGALEAEAGIAAVQIEAVRKGRSEEAKRELSVMAAAAPAPSAPSASVALAFDAVTAAKSPVIMKNLYGSVRQRAADGKSKQGARLKDGAAMLEAADEAQFFEERDKDRAAARRFFQKLDKTQEWAENNYWHLPIGSQVADLVKVNAFWADYAAHDGKTPFLSKAFPEAASNFTEMMLALAVLDVPFKAAAHGEKIEGVGYALQAGSPLVLFHREIREAARAGEPGGMLVAQHFFRADDRERFENSERFDKLVTDEFLPQVVYGAQVVLTNPTGNRQKLNVLMQIPMGAMPVSNGFYTRGAYLVLEPYSTKTLEYFFYFPATGKYTHYPVTLASRDRVVGNAAPMTFNVVAKLSKTDTTSWAWLSQNGTEDDVVAFLGAANLHRIDLEEIAWRMKDKAFFARVTGLLETRHVYHDTLWSYGILHNAPSAIREYLRHSPFAGRCGLWLESPLLTLDPVERFDYQHLEYAPLVNPRAHQVGARRTILNAPFREHYQRFMRVLSYKPKPDAADTLAVAYYMALQDRVAEALAWFGRVDRKAVTEQVQCDYLEAYLAFYKGDTATARRLAKAHADERVDRWRDRFAQVQALLDEIAGGAAGVADKASRDQAQGALAATEPAVEMQVEAGRIRLDTRNVAACTLNFYPMDIELLFSRSPFLQEGAAQFSYIRPVLSLPLAVPAGQGGVTLDLPPEFKTKNVMVEALGGGVRRTQAYYANTLKVQMVESYGQLVVTQAENGTPVPGTYVKVYARMAGGEVRFLKDGYTDLRGRFDYVSLNTNELEAAERLAVLVLSDAFGAVVREAPPPKR